jgi:hypothetical protein
MKKLVNNALNVGFWNLIKNFKFVWLFWATNVVFSIALTLPISFLLTENLLNSIQSENLLFDFDYLWFLQFYRINNKFFEVLPFWIYGASGIYVFIQLFYIGGTIAVFHNPKKNHFVDFFYGGVKYWFRFFKIFLLSLLFYFIFFELIKIFEKIFIIIFSESISDYTLALLNAFSFILSIFFIGVVSMYSDYFKLFVALQERTKILKTIPTVNIFIYNNFIDLFAVFFIVALIGGLGAIVYNIAANFLPREKVVYFILSFILQQILIIFRFAVKIYFYSSAVYLYKELNAEIMEEEIEEIEYY